MYTSNVRLRGTHKILIRKIEAADLSYTLAVREIGSLDSTIRSYIRHVEKSDDPLSAYYMSKVEKELSSTNFPFQFPQTNRQVTYLKFLYSCIALLRDSSKQSLDSLIVNLTHIFDEFLFRVAFKYYQHNPERLKTKITLTFEQFLETHERHNTEYELVKVMVYKKMYSASIEERYKFLREVLSLTGVDYEKKPKDALLELYMVRNALVHNGGFVGGQLKKSFPKYIGFEKVCITAMDYVRFKKAVLHSAQDMRMQFNASNQLLEYNASYFKDVIRRNKDEKVALSRAQRYDGRLIYIDTGFDIIRHIAKKLPKSFYRTTSLLLNSDVFEYKFLAICFLRNRWIKGNDNEKIMVAKYVLSNLIQLTDHLIFSKLYRILSWYISEIEPQAFYALADSKKLAHKRMAIRIFDKKQLIMIDNFGYSAYLRLPLGLKSNYIQDGLDNYLDGVKLNNPRLFKKLFKARQLALDE